MADQMTTSLGVPKVSEPTYSMAALPSNPALWNEYRNAMPVKATRIEGAFNVLTPDGQVHCDDGWLAVDARGFPFPIPSDEFTLTYELIQGVDQ